MLPVAAPTARCPHVYLRGMCGCPDAGVPEIVLPGRLPSDFGITPKPTIAVEPDAARLDSWVNALAGINTHAHDKRTHAHFEARTLTYQDAIELYRGDDLANRAINFVPEECFREGYEINFGNEGAFDDLKDELDERMLELKVDEHLERAMKYERAYGGAAILLGANDGKPLEKPLVLDRVRSLDWLTVMEPIELLPASYYQDVHSPKYGEPEFYRLQSFTVSGAGTVIGVTDRRAPPPTTQLIHESRLMVWGGQRVSRYQRNTGLMGPLWGDSILIKILDILRDFNIAWSAAGMIPIDFAQTVISIENLMTLVSKSPDKVQARLKALDMSRSVARAILVDAKEKVERQSTSVAGLPELLHQLSLRLCAAIDIPLSLLMGNTMKGLSGAGAEHDVRWTYDRIAGKQRREVAPRLRFLVKMIMGTLRKRKLPKRWTIRFNPLWQLTDAERAEARLTQARADSMYVKMGAVTSDEIRRSRFLNGYSFETTIDETKKAPGFMAPLPPGLLPGSTPGPGGVPRGPQQPGKPGAPKLMGPNAHTVSGYARRNPTEKGMGANAKEGGDTEGGKQRRDGAEHRDRLVVARRVYAGLPISVEVPAGRTAEWTSPDGRTGSTLMQYDYGYIEGAQGADGGCVDVWLGPNQDAENAYVVHAMAAPDFLHWAQDKVMLGFDSAHHARDAFLAHYDDPRWFGGITVMSMDAFRHNYAGAAAVAGGEQMASQPSELAEMEHRADRWPPGAPTIGGGNGESSTSTDVDRLPEGARIIAQYIAHADFIEKRGSKWVVKSESGKSLGEYDTKNEAVTRLAQIEWFKAHPDAAGADKVIGSWSEQETGYEVDKPDVTGGEKNPLWNSALQTQNEDGTCDSCGDMLEEWGCPTCHPELEPRDS